MIDFTKAYNKIQNDYNNNDLLVNQLLAYNLNYNNANITVYYTKRNNLSLNIIVVINYNDTLYPLNYQLVNLNSKIEINSYIPNCVYNQIFPLFDNEPKHSPQAFIQFLAQHLPEINPVINNRVNFIGGNHYRYTNSQDKPFFETIIRKNIGPEMQNRIRKSYPAAQKEIIDFCKKYGVTLRFTPDFSRAHNLFDAIEAWKKANNLNEDN